MYLSCNWKQNKKRKYNSKVSKEWFRDHAYSNHKTLQQPESQHIPV